MTELKANRRFNSQPKTKRKIDIAPDDLRSALGETIFPTTRRHPKELKRVLKEGKNSRKIGSHITKGRWKGMPIFTLTLEERATCPRSCLEWSNCYGNHMHFAQRIQPGHDLTAALEKELQKLNRNHRKGFAVRLHVLGDFYHENYVYFWAHMLDQFKRLHVFGFTAHQKNTPIGSVIDWMNGYWDDRFYIRFSGIDTEVVDRKEEVSGILCPVQEDKTDCCGTCGLCWQTTKKISFLRH